MSTGDIGNFEEEVLEMPDFVPDLFDRTNGDGDDE
jgi:hypothetical protein